MARNEPQVNLRIPQVLKNTLEDRSKENNRSLTAEIVARLQESLARETAAPAYVPPPIDPEELAEIERKAKEWGCSKTRALIRMTIEEVGKGK